MTILNSTVLRSFITVASLTSLAMVFACAKKSKDQPSPDPTATTTQSIGKVEQPNKVNTIKSSVVTKAYPHFFLIGPATYQVSIEGCESGYAKTLTEVDTEVRLYIGDRNCLGKLESFSYDGKTYTPETGFEFDTWQVGDEATFISGDFTERYYVKVEAQFSNPVLATDTLDYKFFKLVKSVTDINVAEIKEGNTGYIGAGSADFDLRTIEMLGADGSQETLKFSFTLECSSTLTNTGNPSLVDCNGAKLSDLEYVLISDTYYHQPCDSFTLSTCDSIMSANSPKNVDTASADYISPGTGGLTNGGFQTKTALVDALTTPANFAQDPNLILLVHDTANNNYYYFNVDINVNHVIDGPEFYSISLANDASDGYINAAEHATANALVNNLQGLNYSTAQYKLVSSGTTCDENLTYSSSAPNSNATELTSDGDYKVCVVLSASGFPEIYGNSYLIKLDTSVPNLTSTPFVNEATDSTLTLSEQTLDNAIISVNGTGYDSIGYKITEPSTACDGALAYSDSTPTAGDAAIASEGDYKICVMLSDYAGNPIEYGGSGTFSVKHLPIFTSLDGANEASDNVVTSAEAGSTSPIVNLVASGYTTATYTNILDNTPAQTCDGSQTYGNSSPPQIDSMPAPDDDYVVCVKLEDAYSQVVYGTSDVITRDGSYSLPNLASFSAVPSVSTSASGSIDISITYPPVLDDIDSVEIYRQSGATAPDNDCSSGDLVTTFTSPVANASDSYTDTGLTPSAIYSYRACVRDNASHVNTNEPTHIQENIEASITHTIIVTSTTYNGAALGGIDGADAECQIAGNSLDNTITWKAVLSTTTLDAKTRIAIRGPVFNNNTTPEAVFADAAAFWGAANSAMPANVAWDETGASQASTNIWTGTSGAGVRSTSTCSDWTSTSGQGTYGQTQRTDERWLVNATRGCTNVYRIYCISQPNVEAFDDLTAVAGSLSREIDVSIDFPVDTTNYATVEVRRKLGSVAPDENCDTDTLVASLTSFSDWGPYTDNTGLSGGVFSYRFCVFDDDDILVYTDTLTDVQAQGSVAAGLTVITDTTLSTSGNISVRIDYPTDITEIDTIDIRRTSGATGPADCTDGTVVHTFSSPVSEGYEEWVDSGLTGDSYSYLACEYDGIGGERSEPANLIEDIRPSFMHWVFVSANDYNGNLGGLAGADATCTTLGASLDNTVKWRAVLSDDSTSAYTRFWNLDGVWNTNSSGKSLVQSSMANMFDAGTDLLSGISYDESGSSAGGSARAWTGTYQDGTKYGLACDNWTDGSNGRDARYSDKGVTTERWLDRGTTTCNNSYHIICMSLPNTEEIDGFTAVTGTSNGEIDLDIDFPVDASDFNSAQLRRLAGSIAPEGDCSNGDLVQSFSSFSDWSSTDTGLTNGGVYSYRVCAFDSNSNVISTLVVKAVSAYGTPDPHRVFVSSLTYTGNLGGLSGADSKCQSLAVAQALGGTWKAIVSDTSTGAKDRIIVNGEVQLLDTTVIATNSSDLWDEAIAASINIDETGATVSGGQQVWSGTDGFGSVFAARHCNDWTDGTSSYTGRRGQTNRTNVQWIDRGNTSCDSTLRIYCIDGQ